MTKEEENKRNEAIAKFIGDMAYYDREGQMIFGINNKEEMQLLLNVRGWGAIQQLFKNPDGTLKEEEAMKFQDEMGEFIANAITEKLKRDYCLTLKKD